MPDVSKARCTRCREQDKAGAVEAGVPEISVSVGGAQVTASSAPSSGQWLRKRENQRCENEHEQGGEVIKENPEKRKT